MKKLPQRLFLSFMKKYVLIFLIIPASYCSNTFAGITPKAKWITSEEQNVNKPNTWIAFRKDLNLKNVPRKAVTQIAADSKYWLWINGQLIVFEGGLKRGPNPRDTYFDELDLAPYLKRGENRIAVLLWYFGKEGFSHKDSGKAGLIFNLKADEVELISDRSWFCRIHPAYGNTGDPHPNWRLPESNICFTADNDIEGWQIADCESEFQFSNAQETGSWGDAPWNKLIKRPIPFWKDFGIKQAASVTSIEQNDSIIYTAQLPYNMQMTPIINITDTKGGSLVNIETDHLTGGGEMNLRAEYISKKGLQEYESLGWLNGQKIIIKAPAHVTVNSIKYRETGYDSEPSGSFSCDNEFYMRFWEKGLRTLYVNMRDTYFDCPDRERAQWWGDVVVLMGESFYTYSTSSHALMKKAIYELIGWQREDNTLFSPVPTGNHNQELPAQMLASVGQYGFWNYYMNTGDKETIADVYPGVKKYLSIWQLDETSLTRYRQGGWSWGDWGENIDIRLILAGWHYMALNGAALMADELGYKEDVSQYRDIMEKVKNAYNACWNGYSYRHPKYHLQTDDRVQALAVISGIADQDKYEKIYELLQTQYHASPYMEKYVMEALFMMGYGNYALERTQKRFSPMVNNKDYTTLFEGWGIGSEGYGGGTTNHAWSGGSLTVISQYLCGISPLEPGYKTFKIEPDPASFTSASITVPTVAGEIKSEFINSETSFSMKVTVPDNTNAVIYLPLQDRKEVTINGKVPKGSKYKVKEGLKHQTKTSFMLQAGNYIIKYK